MHIIHNEDVYGENIFNGRRNSEWFNNLQKRFITNDAYHSLPSKSGIPEICPQFIKRDYKDGDFYGFNYIQVGKFKEWFREWRPDKDAGWATTREMWLADHRPHYVPEIKYELSKDDVIEDMHFIEVENIYDCSFWLNSYLVENNIPDDGYIVYYFDC